MSSSRDHSKRYPELPVGATYLVNKKLLRYERRVQGNVIGAIKFKCDRDIPADWERGVRKVKRQARLTETRIRRLKTARILKTASKTLGVFLYTAPDGSVTWRTHITFYEDDHKKVLWCNYATDTYEDDAMRLAIRTRAIFRYALLTEAYPIYEIKQHYNEFREIRNKWAYSHRKNNVPVNLIGSVIGELNYFADLYKVKAVSDSDFKRLLTWVPDVREQPSK